jgi:6-phosphogluconate dehydrogenase
MHIGLIGLGKMGGNMRSRLRKNGVEVTGYARTRDISDVDSIEDLVKALPSPRTVWVMVPHGKATDDVIAELVKFLEPGDLIIDGGNSRFSEDIRHAEELTPHGLGYLDCGVSGGVWGLENGYGLMVGGPAELVERAMPIFDALRPEGKREEGFVHVGDTGAGHYAKMVHNGIEYGMMQSFAEGYELLEKKSIIKDVHGTFAAWQRGTVVRSWLLDLLVRALEEDPNLDNIKGSRGSLSARRRGGRPSCTTTPKSISRPLGTLERAAAQTPTAAGYPLRSCLTANAALHRCALPAPIPAALPPDSEGA